METHGLAAGGSPVYPQGLECMPYRFSPPLNPINVHVLRSRHESEDGSDLSPPVQLVRWAHMDHEQPAELGE